MTRFAALLLALAPQLQAAPPQTCRENGVEWLLGGVAATCAAAPARGQDNSAATSRLRVSAPAQLHRDEIRASILHQELREAEASLARLQGPADATPRQRLQADIAALHKEIARLPAAHRSSRQGG